MTPLQEWRIAGANGNDPRPARGQGRARRASLKRGHVLLRLACRGSSALDDTAAVLGSSLARVFGSSSGLTHAAFLLVEAQAGSSSSSETESAPGSSSSSPKSAESSDKAGDVGLPPLPSMLASGPQQWPAANDFAATLPGYGNNGSLNFYSTHARHLYSL